MNEDSIRLSEALISFVENEIREQYDVIYSTDCLQIVDARNCIILKLHNMQTDESNDIYAVSDLCYIDEDMRTLPNKEKIIRIVESFWR